MFPAALSSTSETMEAQAQGGWSPVAPGVCSSGAQRDSLPSVPNFTPGQTRTSYADGTPRLRAPSGSRLHLLPNSDFAVGLGTREGLGTRKLGTRSAGIVSLSALSLPAVRGPHFLVLKGAQRTCWAGSGSQRCSPQGTGSRESGVFVTQALGLASCCSQVRAGVKRTREVVGFVETQCPCYTRAAAEGDWPSKARELHNPCSLRPPDG